MKKVILILGLLFFCTSYTSIAYAGTLNEYEAIVLEAAKGHYEFEGVIYRVDSVYINQLAEYLSLDEVDLTEEQKDKVLMSTNDYIETGVQEGYLIPVQDVGAIEAANTQADSPEKEVPEAPESEETKEGTVTTVEGPGEGDSEGVNQVDQSDRAEALVDDLLDEIFTKEQGTTTNVDTESGKVIIVDVNESNILTVNTVVKNTGFNLNRTAMIVVGIGILMFFCIYVTVTNDYFAQSDE